MKIKMTHEELASAQFKLELEMKAAGLARFESNNQRALDSGEASATAWNRRIISEITHPMAEAITAYLEEYQGKAGRPSRTLTYLRLLEPRVSAYVTIKVTLDMLAKQATLLQIALAIGSRIEDQVRFSRLERSAPRYIEKVKQSLNQSNTSSYRHGHVKLAVAERSLVEDDTVNKWQDWPKPDKIQLGTRLLGWLADNVLFEDQPIITISKNWSNNKKETSVEASPNMRRWIEEFKSVVGEMAPAYAPCVIPPRDWVSPYKGGYHVPAIANTLPLVKSSRKHVKRLTKKQMPTVYRGVNALQQVRWQINDDILETATKIQELGLPYGMPPAEPYESEPFPFPETELTGKALRESLSKPELSKLEAWKAGRVETLTKERKRKALFLENNRVIGQAKEYQPYENLYFVYTLDFRGRVYAQGSLLTPQGGDLSKALLRFADKEPLGSKGKYWLAVQGANTWGEDKVGFDDRVKWVADNEDDIRDYASDPLTFTGWTDADKPWQFLAFCFEWDRLCTHCENGLTCETFLSSLAVAMDGSCSGIQHYSAMLRDKRGGAAVNLVPDTAPHDIYGDVAEVVRAKLREELEEPELAAMWLTTNNGKDLVDRNCCKKPVMTLPYGSTQITCLKSISEYLSDKGSWYDFGDKRTDAEKFLSPLIWQSIGEVVVAAREGMAFIRKIARACGKANSRIEWVTPTGFIVEQAEYKTTQREVETQLMGRTRIYLQEETDEIDSRRMQSAAAPNFVHSMDASHLIMVSDKLYHRGVKSIAVIHDSFGTHAGKTDELREVLLDCLVWLYQDNDVLEELRTQCELILGEEIEEEPPAMGTLDLSEIRNSPYCFA